MSSFEPPPSDEDVDGLGIKALRELIVSAGLSHADCVEKSDLRARAKLATAKLRDAPAMRGKPDFEELLTAAK